MLQTRIFLSGCFGKMGRVIDELVKESPDLSIVSGFDLLKQSNDYPVYQKASDCKEDFDVIVDFSHPAALPDILSLAKAEEKPVIFCTTGYSDKENDIIREAAKDIPVFSSGNMSLGINLLLALSQKAAVVLYPDFDIEIIEAHHNQKIDAPSGTANMLSGAIQEEIGNLHNVYERQSVRQKRQNNEIGMHSIRGGSIVGEHSVIFAGQEEVVTLSHSAQSRNVFARGALAAVRFMVGKPAGLYSMKDLVR